MTPDNSDCVSIRARVRKSRRAIDPEFDECTETLVSFVERSQGGKGKEAKCHSLLLTPVPTVVPSRARSLSRGNTAPVRRRHRSFGRSTDPPQARKASTASLSSSEMSSAEGQQGLSCTLDSEGMVDVSLEDEKGNAALNDGNSNAANALGASGHSAPAHPLLNPANAKPSGLPKHPAHRYSSPLSVFRTSSGVSAGGASSVVSSSQSDTHVPNGFRSQSVGSRTASRSRSRSRSRRRHGSGGHLRMRSLGAQSAFAAANGTANAGEDEADKGGGTGSGSPAKGPEPVSIPLRDVISVDEEVPARRKGGSDAGSGAEFRSSAASDAGAAAGGGEGKAARATSPRVVSPPPSSSGSNGGRGSLYRIFLHTLSNGYVEFSLDHSNSYDIFMAYLKAHLSPDRVPQKNPDGVGKQPAGGGTALLRTMVLTPTKEVPPSLDSSARTRSISNVQRGIAGVDGRATSISPSSQPRTLPRPHLTRSNSTMGSTNIDKLHSKAIHQRLQNESTPLQRFKEQLAGMMSNLMDCACCQDTTVAPIAEQSSIEATPDSRRLKQQMVGGRKVKTQKKQEPVLSGGNSCGNGMGRLSFEEMSCGTPKLSFERSVGGDSKR